MMAKISQIDFGAKEVNYHGWCPAKHQTENESIFQSKHGKIPNFVSSTQRIEKEIHSEAFDSLCKFIEV